MHRYLRKKCPVVAILLVRISSSFRYTDGQVCTFSGRRANFFPTLSRRSHTLGGRWRRGSRFLQRDRYWRVLYRCPNSESRMVSEGGCNVWVRLSVCWVDADECVGTLFNPWKKNIYSRTKWIFQKTIYASPPRQVQFSRLFPLQHPGSLSSKNYLSGPQFG